MVNHDTEEWEWQGKKYMCRPGQKITSLEKIRKECGKGISIQNIRTAFVRFEKLEFLTYESTKESRLVTVLNWELYQSVESNQQSNQQTGNKDLTTNKNDKNDKNKKKYIYAEFVQMLPLEYQKLINQYGEVKVKKMIEVLNNYKGSNGKKYKSDYLAILNWVVDRVSQGEVKGEQSKYRDMTNYKPGE